MAISPEKWYAVDVRGQKYDPKGFSSFEDLRDAVIMNNRFELEAVSGRNLDIMRQDGFRAEIKDLV